MYNEGQVYLSHCSSESAMDSQPYDPVPFQDGDSTVTPSFVHVPQQLLRLCEKGKWCPGKTSSLLSVLLLVTVR